MPAGSFRSRVLSYSGYGPTDFPLIEVPEAFARQHPEMNKLRWAEIGVTRVLLAPYSRTMAINGQWLSSRPPDAPAGSLGQALAESASEARVPRDLLVAIAKVEEGLAVPRRRVVDADNEVPAAGPLQLRRGKLDTLRRAAELASVSEVDLRSDADLALRAGALVLGELGAKTNATPDDLASWAEAVEEMSGFADETR